MGSPGGLSTQLTPEEDSVGFMQMWRKLCVCVTQGGRERERKRDREREREKKREGGEREGEREGGREGGNMLRMCMLYFYAGTSPS